MTISEKLLNKVDLSDSDVDALILAMRPMVGEDRFIEDIDECTTGNYHQNIFRVKGKLIAVDWEEGPPYEVKSVSTPYEVLEITHIRHSYYKEYRPL